MNQPPRARLALLSLHTSPLATPGMTKAGGMNVYIRELTRELGRAGFQVDVFTRRVRPEDPAVVALGPRVRVISVTAGPAAPLDPDAAAGYVPAFRDGVLAFAAAEGLPYALVHSHYWLSGLAGIDLAAAWQCPHVAMFHTLGEVKHRARRAEAVSAQRVEGERRIVRAADRVICATSHERAFLVDLYGAHASCVCVVPGGVDLDHFHPGDRAAARQALGLHGPVPVEAQIALYVGRLEPLKGADVLLGAVAVAEGDQPLHVLVVGGDGAADPERIRLAALAERLGLGGRVHFPGAVERDRLPLYYQAADVCVVPSYYESFGLVAVEALASGVPVIATRVGGLQTTIRDGQTGYLIPWRCPEPFAERLETLFANADLRARFGRAARESVAEFAWERVCAQVMAVYADLLSGPASPCRDVPGVA